MGQQQVTYAKVLAVLSEIKKIMKEVKNDEKVENKEVEKQLKNFIIHGTDEEVSTNDKQDVKDILGRNGVKNDPENFTRLGNLNEKPRRSIKVEMKTATDKDNVLSNLRKLKGSQEEFGKISITKDYTKSERDEIRSMSEKAKAKLRLTESSED